MFFFGIKKENEQLDALAKKHEEEIKYHEEEIRKHMVIFEFLA